MISHILERTSYRKKQYSYFKSKELKIFSTFDNLDNILGFKYAN